MREKSDLTSNKNLIIIDKNSSWVDWATEVLTREGYSVNAIPFFDDAIYVLEEEKVDLVMLGANVAKEYIDQITIFTKQKKNSIRFLVITPIELDYQVLRSLWKIGVSDIQRKPQNRRQLLEMVSSELREAERANFFSGNKSPLIGVLC